MTTVTTINASLSIQSVINKNVNFGDPTAGSVTIPLSPVRFNQTVNPGSTPNGIDAWSGNEAMVAGTVTIDLTALTQLGLAGTVDMTGNKLRWIIWQAPATNAANVKIAPGASNGYSSVGTVDTIAPGDPGAKVTGSATAVSPTNKTITITGTGTDSLYMWLVFGNLP